METSLYLPVKTFLEARGFSVKGEVCGCDLVGLREGEKPIMIVGELKLTFNLDLVLQGVDRAGLCDEVWLAVRASSRRGRERDPRVRKLCRRLGFGLMVVHGDSEVELAVSPQADLPRRNLKRRSRLMEEHRRRAGDPARGGSSREPVMTAYRQRALVCAAFVASGEVRSKVIKAAVPDARSILYRNVYGWFERTGRGAYALTSTGQEALARWPQTAPRQGV